MTVHAPRLKSRRFALALLFALLASLGAVAGTVSQAAAAPPTFVVAGDTGGGNEWYLNGTYFAELRSIITNTANFGDTGTVRANYSIAAPRSVPLTAGALNGVDVYFLSARDLAPGEGAVLQAFVAGGGAVIANSNAPGFFDDTAWLGLTLTDRVVYGDGAAPYNTTHRAPSPSTPVAGQTGHAVINGPFGTVASFDNWHSVAGFANTGTSTVLARNTLTGPNDNGSSTFITLNNVATLAVFPTGAFGAGSGPVIAASDVDTFSNAYTVSADRFPATDGANTLNGTGNGTLARNAFAWIAAQKMALSGATSGFTPLASPVRALDSRSGVGGPAAAFGPGEAREVNFQAAGVPADATMVAVNITAVDPTAAGFLTAWPAGSGRPTVSNVNFVAGTTVANAAFVKLGPGAAIGMYNSVGSTHVLIDVVGYVSATGSRLVNVNPARIKDTRTGQGGTGIAHTGTTQTLHVAGNGGVPNGATAVVLNVTAVDPTASSYVTVWPADRNQPTVSNINTTAGVTIPNLVVVRLPTSGASAGSINLFNAAGDAHLLVDVLGYFTGAAPLGSVTAETPHRIIDTRITGNPLGAGESRVIATGLSGATAVVINVTAVDPTAAGYLTVYPADGSKPDSSNVNFLAGRVSPNLVVVHPAPDGTVRVFNNTGSTHLVIDVSARFDG